MTVIISQELILNYRATPDKFVFCMNELGLELSDEGVNQSVETLERKIARVINLFSTLSITSFLTNKNPNMLCTEWKADHWFCVIKDQQTTDLITTYYSAGIGHRVNGYPCKPTLKDVLCSLTLEADVKHDTFEEWCNSFGYSSDSIKAKKTYDLCLETLAKLEKFAPLEIFQDYFTDY